MKKMLNIKFLSFLVVVLSIQACSDDFLDRQPLDAEVSSNFYKTEADAQQALIAVYDALGYQSTPGVSWAPFSTISDILSDDAFAGGGDANDGKEEDEVNNFNIPTSTILGQSIWAKNYTGIYRANLLLEVIDDIEASDEFKQRVTAECKFLRAYFYFEQVRFFENIPLLTNTIKGPSEYSQTQNTPAEVYDQIAADLVDAINVLPEVIDPVQNGRISKWAASGLLGRVYLFYNGVYNTDLVANGQTLGNAEILGYLEELIQNSGHELMPDFNEIFLIGSEFSSESVFEISYGDSPAWWDWTYPRGGEGNLAAQMQGPRVTGSDNWDRGWSFAPVSHTLVTAMENDPRLETTVLFQSELDGSLVKGYQHTGYFSQKYSSDAPHWSSDGQFELNRTCNYRVIRFSDVLLMAAELGSPSGQTYLDRVRSRVGLSSVPVTQENIMHERRMEFALEGHRYFDVLRQGLQAANDAFSISGVRGPQYEGDQTIFNVNFNMATKGFLPIPQTEMDLSAGVFNQNEGY